MAHVDSTSSARSQDDQRALELLQALDLLRRWNEATAGLEGAWARYCAQPSPSTYVQLRGALDDAQAVLDAVRTALDQQEQARTMPRADRT